MFSVKKYVFLDVDGTLTTFVNGKEYIPESAVSAVRKAMENGHDIFICSGRPLCMLEHFREYKFNGYIASVGAYIEHNDSVLYDVSLSENQTEFLLNKCIKQGCEFYLETNGSAYGFQSSVDKYTKLYNLPIVLIDGLDKKKVKKVCFEIKREEYNRFVEDIKDEYYITEESYEFYFGGEISLRGMNKGKAIEMICDLLHIEKENTIGIGDSMNDLEMLMTVGHPIVMGNYRNDLDQYAEFITKDIMDDGLEYAFKQYGLID